MWKRVEQPNQVLVRRLAGVGVVVLLTMPLAGCRFVNPAAAARPVTSQDVAGAAGWTRIATTADYFVVANVLPGERMYTATEVAAQHPTVGELIISGVGQPLGANVRHVEAHIYDRATGMPIANLNPSIEVLNRTTGQRVQITSALMQDVAIGDLDIHYGNNVAVMGDSDLTLTVTVGTEVVTLDGHLD